ncbi:MAG: hypothetical protein GY930_02565 [bacterium]|nr:hypothetical protein [bacterium]
MVLPIRALTHRPLPILALGLAAAAVAAQVLTPGALVGSWLVVALAVGCACWRFPILPRNRVWPLASLALIWVTGSRALELDLQPMARGEFQTKWQGRGRELGHLKGHAVAVQLPSGFARDGDRVQVHSSAQQVLYAAPPGQVPAPHSWAVDAGQVRRTQAAQVSIWKVPAPLRNLREHLAGRLAEIEGEDSQGLARALLLGHGADVSHDLKDRFTRTGTRHLLALSGLHVGIMWWLWMRPLCGAIAWLLSLRVAGRGLARDRLGALGALLQVIALLIVLPLLGGGTPALRATLALGLADCARQVIAAPGAPAGAGRRVDPLSIWALALSLELLWQPGSIASVSLQLSYAATLGLILFWAPCHRCLQNLWLAHSFRVHVDSNSLGHPRHPAWPWAYRFFANYVVGGLLASFIATAATLPFTWIHFGEWSPVGMIATLVLLPFVAAGLFLGWAYAVFPWFVPKVWAAWPFAQMPSVLEYFDDWAMTPHLLPIHGGAWAAVAIGGFAFAFHLIKHAHLLAWRRWILRISMLSCGVALMPTSAPPKYMTAHVCDVGHGTAILVRMPCGRNWLFDAGSRDRKGVAKHALIPLLRKLGVRKLHVVISHGDRDHQVALGQIASRVHVLSYTGPKYSFGSAPPTQVSNSGLDMDMGRGWLRSASCHLGRCSSRILRGLAQNGNEGSRNLWLECDGRAILLCGDAEDKGLANIFPNLKGAAPLAALLIPHHGSKQKNLNCLISHTLPEQVWFSASKHSPLAQNWPYENTTTRWTSRDGGWSMEFLPIEESAGNLWGSTPY